MKNETNSGMKTNETPTMFLLDKDKKIIAIPSNIGELKQYSDEISKK